MAKSSIVHYTHWGGGGLFFMVRSGFIPLRYYGKALRAVGVKEDNASGQLSSFQALTSAIAATVGLGNISGVAVAITIGGRELFSGCG